MVKALKSVKSSSADNKASAADPTLKPRLGITDKNREAVIQILNTTLADEFILYTATRNFHWNVTGPQFHDLHVFLDAQYQQLNLIVDEVAERTRTVGGIALGTLAEFLQRSRLEEHPGRYANAPEMLSMLLADHEALIRSLREDAASCDEKFEDVGSSDFLVSVMQQHEKMAWMLRSFLES